MALDLLQVHQRRTARIAVSASAARNQGTSDIVRAARTYLAALECQRLAQPSPEAFASTLEDVTQELMGALPSPARSWGLARKLLNIFVRDVLYNSYLAESSGLMIAEDFMEVPLDSVSAAEIKREFKRQLPPWPGVKKLTPELSVRLQERASRLAKRHGVARVHMDAIWWGAREF